MILTELRLENLRNITTLELAPAPGCNLLTGANGAGKTSILEAIYVLSHGRSFRPGRNEVLVRSGAARANAFGIVQTATGTTRLGLQLEDGRWSGRVDGVAPPSLAALLRQCAVVCFEPGSHAVISGASSERRRLLDWGVFHVEPDFAETARRYRRVLRQRNAALREGSGDAELDAWDEELVLAGGPLAEARARYLNRLAPRLARLLDDYLPELGSSALRIRSGWSSDADLASTLVESRNVDRQRGHTSRGPHRADWMLTFAKLPRREQLSRGQEKLCAIACVLAQAQLYEEDHGEWPIVVLDDLPSELDQAHQSTTLESLRAVSQVFIASTEIPAVLQREPAGFRRFHVEQGQIRTLL